MPWWATILPLLGSPALVWALVSYGKYRTRMRLLMHAFDNGGSQGVRAVGRAIADSEPRHRGGTDAHEPPPIQATAEREPPEEIADGFTETPP